MKRNLQLRILTYTVIAYMLLAFSWWSILLFQKNQDAYKAKVELLQLIAAAEQSVSSPQQFQQTVAYLDLTKKYKRQEWMILGEAIVFVISLVIGVWLINRGYNREMLASQQRQNFLLSITHELKSPIASIRLTLETFLKRTLQKEQQDKLSQNALKETERLNRLVNDLLLAAKIDAAYQPVSEPIIFSDLVDGICEKLRQKYPTAQLELHLPPNEIAIEADQLGMNSVVINLIENAIKYSFENPVIDIDISESDKHLFFNVADQGVGISNNENKKVFDRFYRIGNEDTRQTKGTGLGLYIVNEIVKAHKGTIKVEDNQPTGTIFKVQLLKKSGQLQEGFKSV